MSQTPAGLSPGEPTEAAAAAAVAPTPPPLFSFATNAAFGASTGTTHADSGNSAAFTAPVPSFSFGAPSGGARLSESSTAAAGGGTPSFSFAFGGGNGAPAAAAPFSSPPAFGAASFGAAAASGPSSGDAAAAVVASPDRGAFAARSSGTSGGGAGRRAGASGARRGAAKPSTAAPSDGATLALPLAFSVLELNFDSPSSSAPRANVQLYRHAVECVLGWLSVRELASTMRASRDWLAAVGTMRPAGAPFNCSPFQLEQFLLTSRLTRHVGSFGRVEFDEQQDKDIVSTSVSSSLLALLAEKLPHLRKLAVAFQFRLSAPLTLPPSLKELALDWHTSGAGVPASIHNLSLSGVLAALVKQLQQVEVLELCSGFLWRLLNERSLPDDKVLRLYFAWLRQLPALRQVIIRSQSDQFPTVLIDALHMLPQLERAEFIWIHPSRKKAEVKVPTRNFLLHLLSPSQPMRWQDLGRIAAPLDDELAVKLAAFSTLTQLDIDIGHCTRFDFLAKLPRLTQLRLRCAGAHEEQGKYSAEQWQTLLRVFTAGHCSQLTEFALLGAFHCTSDELVALLRSLPLLRDLTLAGPSAVSSLAFVSQLPSLADTLLALGLHRLPVVKSELLHLHSLRHLEKLELLECVRLDSFERAPYVAQPSLVLPRLAKFSYHAPERDMKEENATGNFLSRHVAKWALPPDAAGSTAAAANADGLLGDRYRQPGSERIVFNGPFELTVQPAERICGASAASSVAQGEFSVVLAEETQLLRPLPGRPHCFYLEATVLDTGADAQCRMLIGLCDPLGLGHMPSGGSDAMTVRWYGNDGGLLLMLSNSATPLPRSTAGVQQPEPWRVGDVIGLLLDRDAQSGRGELCCFLHGVLQFRVSLPRGDGVALQNAPQLARLSHVVVGFLHAATTERIRINFGQEPFHFAPTDDDTKTPVERLSGKGWWNAALGAVRAVFNQE